MNKTGRWTYNDHGNEYWSNDDFETESEAIEAAFEDEGFVKDNYENNNGEYFLNIAAGKIKQPSICDGQDIADTVIEFLKVYHYDEYGEFAEDYLGDVKTEHQNELNELLTKVIEEWAAKNSLKPSHYLIEEETEESYIVGTGNALNWIKEIEGKQ